MLGFYPQREEGELIYSTTARACAILYPDCSMQHIAQRLLGFRYKTFGGIFPNNCRLLQKNVPEIVGLTDEAVIDGSVYHLMAPFLDPGRRAELRESLFASRGFGTRNWFPHSFLRYCPLCAREDERNERPQRWRVLPNHPAVNCCDIHGNLLVTSGAELSVDEIHDPAKWIELDVSAPPVATREEIAVAADVRWLYNQKSALLPGFKKVAAALRALLLQIPGYNAGHGKLRIERVVADMLNKMGTAVRMLDPQISSMNKASILPMKWHVPLQRYSLLAQLIGKRLEDVFYYALTQIQLEIIAPATDAKQARLKRIEEAKQQLAGLVKQHPDLGRKQIRKIDQYSVDLLRREARDFYDQVMPVRRRRGKDSYVDWKSRDEKLWARISEAAASLDLEGCTSIARFLARAGLSRRLFERGKGCLPQTKSLVESHVAKERTMHRIERAKQRLIGLVQQYPDFGRQQILEIDKYAATLVRTKDRNFYEQIMPARRARNRFSNGYWEGRDQELHARISEAAAALSPAACTSISRIRRQVGLSRRIFAKANGRLPKTQSLLKSLVGRQAAA
jgi:hypothetical protein